MISRTTNALAALVPLLAGCFDSTPIVAGGAPIAHSVEGAHGRGFYALPGIECELELDWGGHELFAGRPLYEPASGRARLVIGDSRELRGRTCRKSRSTRTSSSSTACASSAA